jgi:predicted phosphodiesterase
VKFVALSDTHCRHRSLKLPAGDVLLHAGDISYNRSSILEIRDFLDWFGRQPHPYKIFIAGNHDFFFENKTREDIKNLLPEGVFYLKEEACVINGIKIWGSPYTPWFFRWAFNKKRGEPLAKHWHLMPPDTDVLLTHGPVYGILDTVVNGQHVGDRDLLQKVLEVKPKVHVCGHIHEAFGKVKRHGIVFVNACIVNDAYELVNRPVTFDVIPEKTLLQE